MTNVASIASIDDGFSLLKKDNTVEAWGRDIRATSNSRLPKGNVKSIYSGRGFAYLMYDGTVGYYGSYGGPSLNTQAKLTNVKNLFSCCGGSFAALKYDGSVVVWPDWSTDDKWANLLSNVRDIIPSSNSFGLLKKDGTLLPIGPGNAWGYFLASDSVQQKLTDIKTVIYTGGANLALKFDGTLVGWGDRRWGHDADAVADQKDVISIYSTSYAFAVIKEDRSVASWGKYKYNHGNDLIPPVELGGVYTIFANNYAFSALKQDGSVVVWGHSSYGGAIDNSISLQLTNVQIISSTDTAFAALKGDGTVVSWGSVRSGGTVGFQCSWSDVTLSCTSSVSGDVSNQLNNVQAISATKKAFAALKNDGTVVSWGDITMGGNSTGISGLENVRVVFGSTVRYASNLNPYCYPCPNGFYGRGVPNCTACPSDVATGVVKNTFSLGINSRVGQCLKCDQPKFSLDGKSCSGTCTDGSYFPPSFYDGSDAGCRTCDVEGVFYNASSKTCAMCPKGRYAATYDVLDCTECEVGKYAEASGSVGCASCDDTKNVYTGPSGSTTRDNCYRVCPAGKFGLAGIYDRPCQDCLPGTYSNATSNECTLCESGKYNNEVGSTSCSTCDVGKYRLERGMIECLECGIDFFVNQTGAADCSACPEGFGTNDTKGASSCMNKGLYGDCDAGFYKNKNKFCESCREGYYSIGGGEDSPCIPCDRGKYADGIESVQCKLCPSGRYGDIIGATVETSCLECEEGYYNSFPGSSECIACSPGTECPNKVMLRGEECDEGYHSPKKRSTSCKQCPSGHYQSQKGEAQCDACPLGKFGASKGSTTGDNCQECPAGRFSSTNGSSECTLCGKSEYQPLEGQYSCLECTKVGEIGDPGRLSCVEDPDFAALVGDSVLESLYTKGIALYASFTITALFVAISFLVHFKKQGFNRALQSAQALSSEDAEKSSVNVNKVATLTPLQTAMKSGLAGFSFGSEFFLIIGLLEDAPNLGAVMIMFRCAHIIVTGIFVLILYGSEENAQWLEQRGVFKNAQTMHLLLNENFSRASMPFVSGIVLLSLFDCSLLQFLPWNASEMYTESQGFPSLTVLKWTLGTDTVQATASVITQIYFLATNANLDKPNTTGQAKALFGLNISFAVMGAVSGLITLCLKNGLLSRLEKKLDTLNDKGGGENGIEAFYEAGDGAIQKSFTENPMLTYMGSTGTEDARKIKERNAELEAAILKVQSENLELRSEAQTLQSRIEHLESENHDLRTEYGAQL
jgi:hypothetical protein